jgi:hypothetical protein
MSKAVSLHGKDSATISVEFVRRDHHPFREREIGGDLP